MFHVSAATKTTPSIQFIGPSKLLNWKYASCSWHELAQDWATVYGCCVCWVDETRVDWGRSLSVAVATSRIRSLFRAGPQTCPRSLPGPSTCPFDVMVMCLDRESGKCFLQAFAMDKFKIIICWCHWTQRGWTWGGYCFHWAGDSRAWTVRKQFLTSILSSPEAQNHQDVRASN